MSKKQIYKEQNEAFLAELRKEEGIAELPCGVLYRVVKEGNGGQSPTAQSVVTVHYEGRLVNGRVFDESRSRGCPEAFRLNQLIVGWQVALQRMHVGDRWTLYVPAAAGYGSRASGPIPAHSTLIFDIELLGIA
ncbi:MAG: FKBP-type peptidyl-prolyl cis-trans isomerase [Bacteroidaceae bacterium]|nr:FKBP-type peptidyl-prolyl cis-trans isomerase [Bacteroidaceae bacterium]